MEVRCRVWGWMDWQIGALPKELSHKLPLPRQGQGKSPDVTINSVM